MVIESDSGSDIDLDDGASALSSLDWGSGDEGDGLEAEAGSGSAGSRAVGGEETEDAEGGDGEDAPDDDGEADDLPQEQSNGPSSKRRPPPNTGGPQIADSRPDDGMSVPPQPR